MRTRACTGVLRAVVVAALVLVALASSSPAVAASPCANQVIEDWRGNSRIDRLYELQCYQAAIDAFPRELLDYTNFEDAVGRALQSAVHTGGVRTVVTPKTPRTGDSSDGPPPSPVVDTASTTQIPVPVLVLAGMFVLLLGAGGISHLARRSRERHTGDADTP